MYEQKPVNTCFYCIRASDLMFTLTRSGFELPEVISSSSEQLKRVRWKELPQIGILHVLHTVKGTFFRTISNDSF